MKKLFILRVTVQFLVLSLMIGDYCSSATKFAPIPGQFLVKLSKSANPESMRQALSGNVRLKKLLPVELKRGLQGGELLQQVYVTYDSSQSMTEAELKQLIGADNIESIEPVYPLEFFELPSDSLFAHQWYLHNTGQEYLGIRRIEGIENDSLILKRGTSDKDIKVLQFYDSPPAESTKVVVAIVDTGVDTDHPELAGRIWRNPDEIENNGIDDDHNGYIDDIIGYDVSGDRLTFFEPVGDNDPSDSVGHGTHIAGIVASNADGWGVVGIAPWVEIMAVKIRPNATTAVGAAGIVYAVNAGAKVINISWGTPFESGILLEALRFARRNGVFVAIAPGNTGDNERFFPAAFDSTFVVAAGNSDGFMTDFSTFGAHIDIVAPGLDILSLRAEGTDMFASGGEPGVRIIGEDSMYYLSDGTSMATPMIAGAAALLWSFKPELNLDQMKEIIKMGADDLVDPLNQGDTLIGPDTLSGYGYVNIASSFNLVINGGMHFVQPIPRNRYTGAVDIVLVPTAAYSGYWRVDYKLVEGSADWRRVAEGSVLSGDSVNLIFAGTNDNGNLLLRATDKFGNRGSISIVYVRSRKVDISYPQDGQQLEYATPITGSVYGTDFDSMAVFARKEGAASKRLVLSTGEYFDSLLFNWTVSGVDTGNFTLFAYGYFESETVVDSVNVHVISAFAAGWPQSFGGFAAMSPACADLDGDGDKELVIGTSNGLQVFNHDGSVLSGFPVLVSKDVRCVPALYDVDHDNLPEIICTNEDGIHVFNHDGSYADGWPVNCYTGAIPFGYGYPNPTVAPMGRGEDSAVMIINKRGQILAYNFDGSSFFYSLDGLFTSFDPRVTDFLSMGGQTSPFVTSFDIDKDGNFDIVGAYSALAFPYEGIGIFESSTGRPAFGRNDEVVVRMPIVLGTVLVDLDNDDVPEIVCVGIDSTGVHNIWAIKDGSTVVNGWPVSMPNVRGWIGQYPVAADLDLDGSPEILCSFFEFDVAALYVFRADGSSYLIRDGRPAGEALLETVTFGTPVVANLTGDDFPEIVLRAGNILPGTGPEQVFIYDYLMRPLPEWPLPTPARPIEVVSSRYSPLVDDLDGDGLVELILVSDANDMLVWDFDASFEDGENVGRFLADNRNSGVVSLRGVSTDVDEEVLSVLPQDYRLEQNYPNPFNPQTTIEFDLPRHTTVKLEVFNVLGQKVATPVDDALSAGRHRVLFDGAALSSGVYFYRLTTGDKVLKRKMLLLK